MRWRLRFYPTIGHRRKGWLWQTFSRENKREMLLVTVRSFVCQLVGCLGRRERGWTARKQFETWHGPLLLIVATVSTARKPACTHPGLTCRVSSIWPLALLSFPFRGPQSRCRPNFDRILFVNSRELRFSGETSIGFNAVRSTFSRFSPLIRHCHKV